MAARVGFIGLGAMGIGMARNLQRHGLLTAVWNRTRAKAVDFAKDTGCAAAASPAELASGVDVIVSCVSADQDVLEIAEAIIPSVRPESLLIDCSTVSPQTAREAQRRLSVHGIGFVDAPVSGGVEGARHGTLAVMCGGDTGDFRRAEPVLAAMGKIITHFGPAGAGQAAKATNQLMCAGVIQAVAEAMAFAKAEGLPLGDLITTLAQGAGSSWYFVHRAPYMVDNSYPAGFRIALHEKDLRICQAMAGAKGVQLPLVEMTLLHYRRLIEQGYADEDVSALFRLKDALFTRGQDSSSS